MTNEQPNEQSDPLIPARRRIFGRRKSRKLSARQQRLIATLLPKLCIPIDKLNRNPKTLNNLFKNSVKEIWLEVGFGSGEHLLWQAQHNPGTGFIGCEPFINGIASLLGRIEQAGVNNIRLHDEGAADVLDVLPDRSLSRVFILFPDPWPKARHHKRRFISAENIEHLARVIKPGGELRISSDIPDYITASLIQIRRKGGFAWQAEKPDDWRRRPAGWPPTRYEAKAVHEGRTPVHLQFIRTGP